MVGKHRQLGAQTELAGHEEHRKTKNGLRKHMDLGYDILIKILELVANWREPSCDDNDMDPTENSVLNKGSTRDQWRVLERQGTLTLHSCTLVCRAWNLPATRLLYARMVVSQNQLDVLLREVVPNRSVKCLEVGTRWSATMWSIGREVLELALCSDAERARRATLRARKAGWSSDDLAEQCKRVTFVKKTRARGIKHVELLSADWQHTIRMVDFGSPVVGLTHLYTRFISHLSCVKLPDLRDDHLTLLFPHTPNLTHLDISLSPNLTNTTLHTLALSCPKLTHLTAHSLPHLTDDGLASLAYAPNLSLQHINLRSTPYITDAGLCLLFRSHSRTLQSIHLGTPPPSSRSGPHTLPFITDRALRALTIPNLTVLGLAGCAISDEAISGVLRVCGKSLRKLNMNYTPITTNALEAIRAQCTKLCVLEIKVSPQLPRRHIHLSHLTNSDIQGCTRITDLNPLFSLLQQHRGIHLELSTDLRARVVEAGGALLASAGWGT
ncbi:hypothetical protein DFS34DRAFT_427916 [Phlyctochytrium arcticum]|nr:hypothetical protein DFS34DRAFT_427916 [Phlyctochytrium arcticum]